MSDTVYYSEKVYGDAVLVLFDQTGYMGTSSLGLVSSIGRMSSRSKNDIQINSPIVSRTHGEIAFTNGQYYYRDLDSMNGTYLNGSLLGKASPSGRRTSVLNSGDVLGFDICQDGKHWPQRVIALFARNIEKDCHWNCFVLKEEIAEICIGRSDEAGVQIDNNMISEKHASFFCTSNGWAIIDHNSMNGVFLNGKRISIPQYLKDFDVVRIADSYFVFFGDKLFFSEEITKPVPQLIKNSEPKIIKQPPSEPIAPSILQPVIRAEKRENCDRSAHLIINIVERSVVQRFKRMMLLQDINLSISNGEMVLILGGSGAGKTTFINAVMGYEKASGKIIYNDTDIYEEYEQMKYEIGFVPQQDLLRGSDSVYDTLLNAAEMKMPRRYSDKKRESRIDEILEEFGLSRERDTLVSKLSGGQRKRLSIAEEFIADPSLFFLDEPDSGIDDVMGRGIMENLRNIADRGKIVMIITHSPERAADLFDKVLVLAKSTKDNCGHLAFFGSVDEAFHFFEVRAFREIVKKINRLDENGEGLSDYFIEKYNKMKR